MASPDGDGIEFIVCYRDGRTASIWISPWDLRRGDYAARMIARERQRLGEIAEGDIESVSRVSSRP
jgi:hypothetical protein